MINFPRLTLNVGHEVVETLCTFLLFIFLVKYFTKNVENRLTLLISVNILGYGSC